MHTWRVVDEYKEDEHSENSPQRIAERQRDLFDENSTDPKGRDRHLNEIGRG